MRTDCLLFFFSATFALARSAELETEVRSALNQAVKNVKAGNEGAKELGPSEQGGQSQKASEDAMRVQHFGDVLEEATRLLIAQHGAAIVVRAQKELNITALLAELAGDILPASDVEAHPRNKRYDSGNEDDPLSTKCIDRRPVREMGGSHGHPRRGKGKGKGRRVKWTVYPYRTISGFGNVPKNPLVGSTLYTLRRFMASTKYDDGLGAIREKSVAGGLLPSTRLVSNNVHAEAKVPVYDAKFSQLHMQLGQFAAHDVIRMPSAVGKNNVALDCNACSSSSSSKNCAPIAVPDGDGYFPSRDSSGNAQCIRFTRIINGQTHFGERAQINQNTHFLDLSTLYGSTDCESRAIRSFRNGMMATYTNGNFYLPPQAPNDTNCQSTSLGYPCFLAGDFRSTLHPGLPPVHTIFVRLHNNFASKIAEMRPWWTEEDIYQETRRFLVAIWQKIIYTEYLPTIIGEKKLDEYKLRPSGLSNLFNEAVNPSVSGEFGAAAFRFGHSQARDNFARTDQNNRTTASPIGIGDNVFYSDRFYERPSTVFEVAHGMMFAQAMAVDRQFSFPIRHQLFETRNKKASGVDLVAVNIQRGRDLGLHPYNDVRERIGLRRANSFDDLKKDMAAENVELLKKTYKSVEDIDLYTGLLLENVVDKTAILGPVGSTIIVEQFASWKRGDRFFYENAKVSGGLNSDEYEAIRNYTLSQLLCETVTETDSIPRNPFVVGSPKVACSSFKAFPLDRVLSSFGRYGRNNWKYY